MTSPWATLLQIEDGEWVNIEYYHDGDVMKVVTHKDESQEDDDGQDWKCCLFSWETAR